MAAIKTYTDISQSKTLSKILPLESADMYYAYYHNPVSGASYYEEYPMFYKPICNPNESVPCWSLAALLAFLPNSAFLERGSVTELYRVTLPVELEASDWYIEPIDACYEMILKLHELKML